MPPTNSIFFTMAGVNQPRHINNWAMFRLLMWKNLILVIRHKIEAAIDILGPIIVPCILIFVRVKSKLEVYKDPFEYQSLPLINPTWSPPLAFEWAVAYSPRNALLDTMMNQVKSKMNLTQIYSYTSERELNARLSNESNRPLAGIIFDECFTGHTGVLPKNLIFRMRFPAELRSPPSSIEIETKNWQTESMFPVFPSIRPRNKNSSTGGYPPAYYDEKFSSIQSAISLWFINARSSNFTKSEKYSIPYIRLQRFGFPAATVDTLLESMKSVIFYLFWLAFWYPCTNSVNVSEAFYF